MSGWSEKVVDVALVTIPGDEIGCPDRGRDIAAGDWRWWYLLPVAAWLAALRGVVVDLGWLGVAVFAAAYVGAVVLLAPGSLLTIAAGFAYGFWGLPIALAAATAGASIAFLIARHLARDSVKRAIDDATQHRRDRSGDFRRRVEDRAVAPPDPLVPFNLQNYLFGITAIPFGSYVAATFVGIAPATSVICGGRRARRSGARQPAREMGLARRRPPRNPGGCRSGHAKGTGACCAMPE